VGRNPRAVRGHRRFSGGGCQCGPGLCGIDQRPPLRPERPRQRRGDLEIPRSIENPRRSDAHRGHPGHPVIASDGAVIVGSDDGYLYALNPSGTLRWKFPAAGSPLGAIRSKPAIGADGIIYFAADDGKLYAVDPAVNEPPNIRELYLTSPNWAPAVADVNNWFAEGPWAVRLEVERERFDANADGKFTYTLKTWLKKCTDADCTNVVGLPSSRTPASPMTGPPPAYRR